MSKRLIKKIVSKGEETVLEIIRPSLWSRFWQIILAIILVNLPFFLIYPLFLRGYWGVTIFSALLLLAVIYLLRIYYGYYYTALVITNKRLVDVSQKGFFNFSAITILYGKIQDVDYRSRGLLKNIFKIGNIYITFIKDRENFIELKSISRPTEVVERILEERDRYLSQKRKSLGEEAIKTLARIREKLGEARFRELISP